MIYSACSFPLYFTDTQKHLSPSSVKKVKAVKKLFAVLFVISISIVSAYAQGKGIDNQNDRIRDAGNDRLPGNNGTKQDVGTGRGIDFGRGKTPATVTIPNPYRVTARRDAILKAVEELMQERSLVRDDAASKPAEGMVVTQPYTFIKGAVVTQSELNRYAEVPTAESRGWTRARYTISFEIQPIDGINTNVSVTARVEGRTDGASGAEWMTLRSTGAAEQEILSALIEKITGAPPVVGQP